jgi:hypothetical protein
VEDVEKFTRRNIHMKNLKKVLALVLVIAMVMGFAVSASATEFSDADTIAEQNETAVEVLTALNIINGYPDGTYRPTGSVTRAEVAKMIAVAFNNGDESLNSLYQNVACGLTDIGGTWAEGYIKYCYATGIVSGYPDGTFKPENPVTGNELCQIMLNILGYEIDTTNTPWATAVMAKSSSIGLLKNVSTAAGSACPRQEAAQIIYNALTLPILQANAMGVLVPSTDTILSKYLGGASEVVVVTGNEEAALNDTTPLDEGKTEVNNDTVLNWSTTMDMIGQSYTVWTVGKTVVYAEDSGLNKIEEFTADANLSRAVSMKTNADTEDYVNFDDQAAEYYTADVVITYTLDEVTLTADIIKELQSYGYASDLKVGKTLSADSVKIKAGAKVSDDALAIIHYIFANYNEDSSTVVVGTKDEGDISNVTSFRKFVSNYLTAEGATVEVTANENGNYVKVVDNDGDGVAEYILKTVYVMDTITGIAKNGNYTLAGEYNTKTEKVVATTVAADAMVSDDELAEGDVIVYALIDGVYYANLAKVVTETIDAKGINYKTKVITCGDNTYGQSYIGLDLTAFNSAFLYDTFKDDITSADTGVAYDLYLDNYNYVRAYTVNKYTNGLGLLTDAYFGTDNRTNTAKVTMVTADTEATDYDVNATDTTVKLTALARYDGFINTTEGDTDDADDHGNRGTWKRLIAFQGKQNNSDSGTAFKTNIAAYSEADGIVTLYDPANANAVTNKELKVIKEELNLSANSTSLAVNNRSFTTYGTTEDETTKTVRPTTDTVYYYVSGGKVITWTGYENAPKNLSLTTDDIAYTVATGTKTTTNSSLYYYYADVIVIEASSSLSNVYFGYYSNTKDGNAASYWLNVIGAYTDDDGDTAYGTTTEQIAKKDVKVLQSTPAFYRITANGTATSIDPANAAANHIYASVAAVGKDVNLRNYVALQDGNSFYTSQVPVYAVTYTANPNVFLSYDVTETTVTTGDELIYVTDGKNVLYAINVTASKNLRDGADLTELYSDIANGSDAKRTLTVEDNDLGITVTGATLTGGKADVTKGTTVTLTLTDDTVATVTVDGEVLKTIKKSETAEITMDANHTVVITEVESNVVASLDTVTAGTSVGVIFNKVYEDADTDAEKTKIQLTNTEIQALGLDKDSFTITKADPTSLAGDATVTVSEAVISGTDEATVELTVSDALEENDEITLTVATATKTYGSDTATVGAAG